MQKKSSQLNDITASAHRYIIKKGAYLYYMFPSYLWTAHPNGISDVSNTGTGRGASGRGSRSRSRSRSSS